MIYNSNRYSNSRACEVTMKPKIQQSCVVAWKGEQDRAPEGVSMLVHIYPGNLASRSFIALSCELKNCCLTTDTAEGIRNDSSGRLDEECSRVINWLMIMRAIKTRGAYNIITDRPETGSPSLASFISVGDCLLIGINKVLDMPWTGTKDCLNKSIFKTPTFIFRPLTWLIVNLVAGVWA